MCTQGVHAINVCFVWHVHARTINQNAAHSDMCDMCDHHMYVYTCACVVNMVGGVQCAAVYTRCVRNQHILHTYILSLVNAT